jgi:hypothetical protein
LGRFFASTVIDYINEYETSSSGQQLAVHCPADSLVLLRLEMLKPANIRLSVNDKLIL